MVIEEADYDVTLIIRLSTRIYFAPIERSGPITRADAIDNAWGCIPDDIVKQIEDGFGGEFDVMLDAEAMAE